MDRYTPPFLGRRGWLLVCQVLLIGLIASMALLDPGKHLWWLAAIAVLVAFFSASQDIVFDAYKTDLLPADQRGSGAAISVLGYRLAMLVSGGLALWLADRYLGWHATYVLMALLLPGIIATLRAPEPVLDAPAPHTLEQAMFAPLRDFFSRNNAWLILLLIVLYKFGRRLCDEPEYPVPDSRRRFQCRRRRTGQQNVGVTRHHYWCLVRRVVNATYDLVPCAAVIQHLAGRL